MDKLFLLSLYPFYIQMYALRVTMLLPHETETKSIIELGTKGNI
jgi:hypothetical protein